MYSMVPFSRRDNSIFRFMDDIENGFFNNNISGVGQFRTDIKEQDGNYLLEAELPGFDKKDIHVEVDGDMLTISASHEEKNDEKDKEGNYIRRERRYGSFSRSFNANGIDLDKITADYKDGVLSLTMPKAAETKPEIRKIEIGG
ncbi:MAG: Hsp20/alpha crystallin family protein [Ruminococcaceae bacterium]|nr:Hsp20/alpha crystallin family protein [Oscillospiraceae bacterium]